MSDLIIANKTDFIEVANAIREKAGTSDPLAFPSGFVSAVEGIGSENVAACVVSVESSNANVVGNVVNIVTAISITAEDYTI